MLEFGFDVQPVVVKVNTVLPAGDMAAWMAVTVRQRGG